MKLWCIQAPDGRFHHGPHKDSGACWGAAVEAWLYEARRDARAALAGLSGLPSAEGAEVVEAPAAALVGGVATEATDGELEVVSEQTVRPGRSVRLKIPKRSAR